MTESNPYESPSSTGIRGSCTSDNYVEFDFVLADSRWFALRENLTQQNNLIRKYQFRIGLLIFIFGVAGLCCLGLFDTFVVSLPAFCFAGYFLYRLLTAKRLFDKAWGKQLDKMLASRSNAGVYGRCSVRLEENGVKTERPAGYSFWHWWAVPEVTVDNDYLLIYLSSADATLVPSRAFSTEAHFEVFVTNARRLWDAKKTNTAQ